MLAVVSLVVPVFGLIGLGFLTARARWLDDGAARVLAQFGYKVAAPALLFRAMASAGMPDVSLADFVGAYFAAVVTTWLVATLATRFLLRRPAVDAPSIAMGSCFGNGVMLGIPLILGSLGDEGARPLAFLVTLETTFLWIAATMHMEAANRGLKSISFAAVGGIVRDVALNPIVGSVLLGIAWAATGLTMPAIPDKLIALLAQSAIPVSLFALGMALAAYSITGQIATLGLICLLKLVFYPALALIFAVWVFKLPPLWASALFLFTSMPVGANAFLFATVSGRAVGSVSAAIAVSTGIVIFSFSLVLAALQGGWLPIQP